MLGSEGLVMSLCRRLDKILQMCPCFVSSMTHSIGSSSLPREEISQIDKFAMPLIFNVDHTPSVLPSADRLAVDNDTSLRSDNCEWEHFLRVS